jgi:hypothetical protein
LGDIVSGDIPNPDAKLSIDGNGNLVVETPNGVADFDAIETEKLNTTIYLDPATESVAEMQSRVDSAGSGTRFRLVGDTSSWDGALTIPSRCVVDLSGRTLQMADGQTGDMFALADETNGTENVTFLAYGAELDGKRSTLAAGEDSFAFNLRGDNGGTGNTDNFSRNIYLYGGEIHDFGKHGVLFSRIISGGVTGVESHDNGEAGDTANGGDGLYAAACRHVWFTDSDAYGNARHGASLTGTGDARCVRCGFDNLSTATNGNDGLNSEETEKIVVDGCESINDGANGLHINGTGIVSNTVVRGSGNGITLTARNWSATASFITGRTDDTKALKVDGCDFQDIGGSISLRGDGNDVHVSVSDSTVEGTNGANPAITNANDVRMHVSDCTIRDVPERAIYFGFNTDSTRCTATGNTIESWDRDGEGFAAIQSGGQLGDRMVVSGNTISDPATGTADAINIAGGDYHAVTGNATGGQTVSVAGTNSVTASNS